MPRQYVMWLIGIGSAIIVLLIALIVIVAIDDGEVPSAATAPLETATSETSATEAPGTTGTTAAPPPTEAPHTTSTTPETLPPTSTTTTTTTTTVPPGPGCVDVGPIPGGATDVSGLSGDFDGDNLPDDLNSYQLGGEWFLWAHLSDGDYRLVTPINLPWSFANWTGTVPDPVIVESVRYLGDPREVAVVTILQGLGQAYALFAVESCDIVPFVDGAGQIPDLWQAMGPVHTDFPVCDVPDPFVRMVVLSCNDMSICPEFDTHITRYELTRDPATVAIIDDFDTMTTRPDYTAMLANSCLGS